MTKILAESLQEWRDTNKVNEEVLNEAFNTKAALVKFLKNPAKYPKTFKSIFKNQMAKFRDLETLIDALSDEDKKLWAEKGLAFIKANPSKDVLQFPLVHPAKSGTGKIAIVDVNSDNASFASKSKGARGGIHGGSTVRG